MHNGLPCTDCKMSYTWQRCNVGPQRLRRHSRAHRLHYCSVPPTSGRRIRFVEWIFKRDCGAYNTPRAAGVPRRHEERRVRRRRTPSCRGRSTTAVHRHARRCGNADGGRGPSRDRRARGPGRARSRRRSSGSAATRPVRAASRSRARPARRTASPSTDVDTRIRVVETAANEGGAAQAVSPVTASSTSSCPRRPARRLPRHEGRLPHRLVLNEVVAKQTGDNGDAQVKVSDDRGFRVAASRSRVTPTGLLAGSSAARKTSTRQRLGHVHLPRDRHRHHLRVRRGRRKGEKPRAAISTLEPVQGARPLGPLGSAGFCRNTSVEPVKLRAFLPSGRKGADPSQRSIPLVLFSLALASSCRPDPRACSSRAPRGRGAADQHTGDRHRHPPRSARS